MFTICSRHRPSRRSPGRRSDGPGQGPVKPESAGFGPIPGKTRGFLADTIYLATRAAKVTVAALSGAATPHEACDLWADLMSLKGSPVRIRSGSPERSGIYTFDSVTVH